MKENYSERPQETWLEVLHKAPGSTAIAHFCENITEIEGENGTFYSADHYAMETAYRPGLEKSLLDNRKAWLAAAIRTEETGEKKTEIEILQDGMAALRESNESLNATVDALTTAILEGGI